MKVLLIEDDIQLARIIKNILSPLYSLDIVHDGKSGEYSASINDYDLLLIDISLPDISGIDVATNLRTRHINTPIIYITAQGNPDDIARALNSGGDDYVTKPFTSVELHARIKAVLRRGSQHAINNTIGVGNLLIDIDRRIVYRDNTRIYLRKKEFDILEYLIRNKQRVITRGMILEHVWETGMIDELSNTVDVHMKHLRDKVDKPFKNKLIRTVHGLGYRIDDES